MGVRARVRYLAPSSAGPGIPVSIGDPESVAKHTAEHEVNINDLRMIRSSVDAEGFELLDHTTKVRDFREEREVRDVYAGEITDLVTQYTGAQATFVTDYHIRRENSRQYEDSYAMFFHGDKPLGDARGYTVRRLGEIDAGLSTGHREFAWFNTWQPIDREVQQNPLALIDATTVEPGDLSQYCYAGYGDDGRETSITYNPAHRVYYCPRMQTSELLLFKQLDTRPGRAGTCLHGSFVDPTAPADALGRRSIEVRLLCVFQKDGAFGKDGEDHPERSAS